MILTSNIKEQIKQKFIDSKVTGLSVCTFNDNETENMCLGKVDSNDTNLVNKNTIFHACSISKMVTALTVLLLVQKRVLNLNTDVNSYLNDWKINESEYSTAKKVTLKNLLAHQAGLIDDNTGFEPYSPSDKLPSINDILSESKYGGDSFSLKYSPESRFEYSDAGYCIIEKIIETVTTKSFTEVVNELIFTPLELKKTFFLSYEQLQQYPKQYELAVGHDKDGNNVSNKRAFYPYMAAAGLWTTPYELSLIVWQIIKAINNDKTSILNHNLAKQMLTSLGEECNPYVGLGVFLSINNRAMFQSQGWGVGFQSMLVADAKKRCGVIVMINNNPGIPQGESIVGDVLKLIKKNIMDVN